MAPTVDGVVHDTKVVYEWLLKQVQPKRILIWGHSLGTGVTVSPKTKYKWRLSNK